MRQHHAPRHDRRDFPVQIQPPTQIKQRRQVGLAEFPRARLALSVGMRMSMSMPRGGACPGVGGRGRGGGGGEGGKRAVAERDVGRQVGEGFGRAGGHEGVAAGLVAAGFGVALEEPGHVVHAGFLEAVVPWVSDWVFGR